MIDTKKTASLLELRKVEPLMSWDDIKEGEVYHLPPLIFNKRMDFVVTKKEENSMKIRKFGSEFPQTMFRTDITTRFVVKKQEIHGRT